LLLLLPFHLTNWLLLLLVVLALLMMLYSGSSGAATIALMLDGERSTCNHLGSCCKPCSSVYAGKQQQHFCEQLTCCFASW
jgi:hypothetical protein